MEPVTKKLKIRGLVQGVGFRYSMVSAAEKDGVTGWVRNCQDGNVEAMIQGSAEQVESLIAWAKSGPPGAQVDHVEVSEGSGSFTDFTIEF